MPKKLGPNSKSVEAKARRQSAKLAKEEQLAKEKEDEYWKDDNKLVNRKMERHQQREKKKQEVLDRKAQNKAAYEQELSTLEVSRAPGKNSAKVTRSQIESLISQQKEEKETPKKELTHLEVSLVENVNRMTIEGEEARNIDEAISVLSNKDQESIDRHPERRVKAAYAVFEENNLTRLKNENPNLRLSQLKQMLKKEWLKSPDNPLNQRTTTSFNTK